MNSQQSISNAIIAKKQSVEALLAKIKNPPANSTKDSKLQDLQSLQSALIDYVQFKLKSYKEMSQQANNAVNQKLLTEQQKTVAAEQNLQDMNEFFSKSIEIIGQVNQEMDK